jgi:hypothetical protein
MILIYKYQNKKYYFYIFFILKTLFKNIMYNIKHTNTQESTMALKRLGNQAFKS